MPRRDPHEQLAGAAADIEHARAGSQRERADRVVDRRLRQRVGEGDAAMRDGGERRPVHPSSRSTAATASRVQAAQSSGGVVSTSTGMFHVAAAVRTTSAPPASASSGSDPAPS